MASPKALIVSDHELLIRGLREMLREADVDVIGIAPTVEQARRHLRVEQPDLLFVETDIAPDTHVYLLLAQAPHVRGLIFVTLQENDVVVITRQRVPALSADLVRALAEDAPWALHPEREGSWP